MTTDLNYSTIKLAHQVRDFEEKRLQDRKKHTLYVVHQYLKDEGYHSTAQQFESEASLSNQFVVCDNIDLYTILQEFESYFFLRFQKYPKICKKILPGGGDGKSKLQRKSSENGFDCKLIASSLSCPKQNKTSSKAPGNSTRGKNKPFVSDFDITILPITAPNPNVHLQPIESDLSSERIVKPISGLEGYTGEMKEFADIISKEIFVQDLNVRWEDIMGLESAKRLLKEAVVYPTKYPELFTGILAPWKGLLLYGPPGTGKTLLAKAVASECRTTFFNISASSIVSKWRGDSEKLVRVMFEVARYHAPSTIFIDELDALAGRRDHAVEHEASRRLKTELLVQLDGLAQSDERVFLLATSNLPWDLDPAMLRRLEKRILVDLPNLAARREMIKHNLPPLVLERPKLTADLDYDLLAEKTASYSGSDIRLVCKEAAMQAMRQAFGHLESSTNNELGKLQLKPMTTADVEAALTRTKPSNSSLVGKYRKWQTEYGST
ncbi:katanin p60 ATPase-containing subunit A-like 2 [Macrosteles quadrilineatus]|uniref:katanin p60 ATPase-containing subunit A-like 2 n=1 Tax=Macrosteles quadrilineatus TaxID=74068 RepID=UPI0023E09E8A|nr:katanin p60 ATPase-containing subunit A-like 2 [Macrosteles quadrilineatus]